jgi:hypothetical protein
MNCPKCNSPLKAVLRPFDDVPIVSCKACQIYSVQGDDQWFSREELGDDKLDRCLTARFVHFDKIENAKQVRYQDCPEGKLKAC